MKETRILKMLERKDGRKISKRKRGGNSGGR